MRSLVILTHTNATYGVLDVEDIQEIGVSLNTPINGETHFIYFIDQVEDNQEAVASNNPYTTGKIFSIAYTLVFKVGFYPLECK